MNPGDAEGLPRARTNPLEPDAPAAESEAEAGVVRPDCLLDDAVEDLQGLEAEERERVSSDELLEDPGAAADVADVLDEAVEAASLEDVRLLHPLFARELLAAAGVCLEVAVMEALLLLHRRQLSRRV